MRKRLEMLLPVILALSLLLIYMLTMAPGLTWANFGVDGGDLITAAATGGVPHPSGYPLYLLIARAFQWLPFGPLAFRTNLMSAVFATLAALLVYEIVIKLLANQDAVSKHFAGLLAGYSLGLSPILWSQAVISEVYTLNAFFSALIFYLAIYPIPDNDTGKRKLAGVQGLILGLALSNHVTIVLLAPLAWLVNAVENGRLRWKSAIIQIVGVLTGLAMYITLYFKALAQPVVNWGNPVTLQRLWWLVSGQIYQQRYLSIKSLAEYLDRVSDWAAQWRDQFGLLGLTLGFIGLVIYFRRSRLYLLTVWSMVIFSAFAIIYRTADAFVYLLPALVAFSIWIGIGVGNLAASYLCQPLVKWGFFLIILVSFVNLTVAHWPGVNASKDARAENFGRQALAVAPPNALIFAKGDAAAFSLWYFHYALQERSDVVIIAYDFLSLDWYQETIQTVYPILVVPEYLPRPEVLAAANPDRPICYVQYTWEAIINCEQPTLSGLK